MTIDTSKTSRWKRASSRYRSQIPRNDLEAIIETAPAPSPRKRYLSEVATTAKAHAIVCEAEAKGAHADSKETVKTLSRERIIGSNDLLDLNYLELAVAVSRAVARIRIGNEAGTGSLVGPDILMTNNHVIATMAEAKTAIVQFDYQDNASGELLPVQSFTLQPDRFFVTDPELDFTLIAVQGTSEKGRPLSDYPWLPLIARTGKAEKGDPLNIIQHPKGGLKQIALRNNTIIEIPTSKAAFLYYTTDTEPGSSGSPCFNDQWELVGLHHSGVPRMDGDRILKRDGKPFEEGSDDPALIDWIANEGARVSAIVTSLNAASLTGAKADLRAALLSQKPPNPVEVARKARGPESSNVVVPVSGPSVSGNGLTVGSAGGGAVTVTVPLNITISLGLPAAAAPAPAAVAASAAVSPAASPAVDATEAVTIDPNFAGRRGYDPRFLGFEVPLPRLSPEMEADSVEIPQQFRNGSDRFVFPYHHFSLAMSKSRRFAWYSAANVDGARRDFKFPKRRDRWFIDPRIDPDVNNPTVQCGEDLYSADNTDRGHLTRYLDVGWGDTLEEAVRALNDTFHFSNACLQLSGFNQGKDRWQGLEQFLLEKKAKPEKRQLVVFTGPLFTTKDPAYKNSAMKVAVRIPLRFWKVCVLIRLDSTVAATAFVLDQEDVQSLPGFEEKFDVTAAQITISELEQRTGLDFGPLRDLDHFAQSGAAGTLESTGPRLIRPISAFEDILI